LIVDCCSPIAGGGLRCSEKCALHGRPVAFATAGRISPDDNLINALTSCAVQIISFEHPVLTGCLHERDRNM